MIFFWGISIVLFAGVGMTAAAAPAGRPSLAAFRAFGILGVIIGLLWMAALIPTIAVQVRRLHDTNRSAWWIGGFYLLYGVYLVLWVGSLTAAMGSALQGGNLPPPLNPQLLAGVGIVGVAVFLYSIVLLVFYCLPGTTGGNRFGDDPYGPDVRQVFA